MAQQRFIERHGLWTDEQRAAADALSRRVKEKDLRQIRISLGRPARHPARQDADDDGLPALAAQRQGLPVRDVIFDTTNNPVVPLFGEGAYGVAELTGFPDGILVPDPATFRPLPWVEAPAGSSPTCTSRTAARHRSRRAAAPAGLADLAERGYDFMAGLEVEFYVFRLEDKKLKPEQSRLAAGAADRLTAAHGFQYLTEIRNDEIHDMLWVLQDNLEPSTCRCGPSRTSGGPGQIEFTFAPQNGITRPTRCCCFAARSSRSAGATASRHVHGAPGVARLLRERLARAPVAGRRGRRAQRLHRPTTAATC